MDALPLDRTLRVRLQEALHPQIVSESRLVWRHVARDYRNDLIGRMECVGGEWELINYYY